MLQTRGMVAKRKDLIARNQEANAQALGGGYPAATNYCGNDEFRTSRRRHLSKKGSVKSSPLRIDYGTVDGNPRMAHRFLTPSSLRHHLPRYRYQYQYHLSHPHLLPRLALLEGGHRQPPRGSRKFLRRGVLDIFCSCSIVRPAAWLAAVISNVNFPASHSHTRLR